MYYSLERVCKDFHLYIFAFDEDTYKILKQLNLANATVIPLIQLEGPELLNVKPTRTPVEYCWTATPATIYYVIKKFNVESCTYIDADIYFYRSPKVIFDEMGDHSVLITEHRFSSEYIKEEKLNGKYCVQFITFKNDQYGLEALNWWKNQCIIWCYNRVEDRKFGDQKYLDDWTTRFEKVHVLQHLGCGVAPWNISQYEFIGEDKNFYGVEKKSGLQFDIVFYHFQYIRYFTNGKLELGARIIPNNAKKYFYKPYLKELDEIKKNVIKINPSFDPHGTEKQVYNWKTPLSFLKRKYLGMHNVYKLEELLNS
jgi:hypothetical protein